MPPTGAVRCSPPVKPNACSRLCKGGAAGRRGTTSDSGPDGYLFGSSYGTQEGTRREDKPAERESARRGCEGKA